MTPSADEGGTELDRSWLEDVFALLRIPSISGSDAHAGEVLRCAEWLRDYICAGAGTADLVPTKGQPLVVGRIDATAANPASAPTILLYAHFDVQPPGDETLWHSPPFEPEIRDGCIYGRGSADDKIHLYILIRAALDLAAEGALPVNVRIVGDGEEESIGDTVVDWLRDDTERTDLALALDGTLLRPGQAVFTIATRGLCFYTVEVETGARDLHSGTFGGVALNAIHVLNTILAAVVPPPGELSVGSIEPSEATIAEWDAAEDWPGALEAAGGRPLSAEALADYNRTVGFTPTVDVNGVSSGDTVLDSTIIPAHARAHVSLRLAPGQQTDVVCPIFERLLRDAAHPDATVRLVQRAANPGSYTSPDLPALVLIAKAFERVMGAAPVTLPWGASVPVMAALDERGIPNVLTGFGLPDAAMHAPNERFPLAHLGLGMSAVRESLRVLGALGGSTSAGGGGMSP
jgi:acetylornithine deacetylase/succinyl-diaminopimelate desuccinylase-like protein